jgi:hypothetical protein
MKSLLNPNPNPGINIPMTDYVNILSRAVTDKPNYEGRRGVYERARQALVAQLRKADPPLSESDITKQRLALESAIRDVEKQAAGGQPMIPKPANDSVPDSRASEAGGAAVESVIAEEPRIAPAAPMPTKLKPITADIGQGKGDPLLKRVATYPKGALKNFKRPNNLTLILGAVGLVAFLGILAGWTFVRGHIASDKEAALIGNKIADRVAQDESLQVQGATVAQTAYLVEENIDAQKGVENFRGKIAWRIDTQAGSEGGAPEKIIRGLVEIPERNLKMLMTIRRNADPALPASHTIELLFDVPKDFVHGAVESIAGVRMKPSEQANGLPLASAAVRITTGYFLIALSAPADDTNTVLLRDRPWLDVLLIYRNGRRAVLTMEKGIVGENVFNEAFKAWGAGS